MSKKYFPIKTETSCRLKWSWSSLFLNKGTTASCHRSSFSQIPEDFDSFHNTHEKLAARQEMINGHWPQGGCEYCRDIELSGGISDRVFQNQIPDIYPSELDADQTLLNVKPVVLEVFFSNICNMKCIYCNAAFSSSIQEEDERYGESVVPEKAFEPSSNLYRDLTPKFWKWFDDNSSTLGRLQILGGEPLYQKDFLLLIQKLNETPCPDLELCIVSNLCVPAKSFSRSADLLANLVKHKKVKRVEINASIDCWGEEQEYIRHGFDMVLFEENLTTLLNHSCFRIGFLSTVTSLSIKAMPRLLQKYLSWSTKQKIYWYPHFVMPMHNAMHPCFFDKSVFDIDLLNLINNIPVNDWDDEQLVAALNGIRSKIITLGQDDQQKQLEMISYLDKIDQRRNTKWKTVFPWLVEYNNVVS